jgi:MFS transporter, putative metabolite:H+ symporter
VEPIRIMANKRTAYLAVLAAALGYFVDIYDLILFSVVRKASLESIGVPSAEILDTGLRLLNWQMSGMLVGGVLWGILGDRRGRLSVLFGSILLYSVANLANAAVESVGTYAVLRFVAGVGLAGELGAGVTLVSELLGRETRGYGTSLVASVGILGAVAAVLVAETFDWRAAYVVGGVLGLVLLGLRFSVRESSMFHSARTRATHRGSFLALFSRRRRALRYLALILVACPIWYVVGLLVTAAPEFAAALRSPFQPNAGRAILWTYVGLVVGGLASGLLSQVLRSRKRAIATFVGLTAAGCVLYFAGAARSLAQFYGLCFGLGVAAGYWSVFITAAAEQFGTNLRATAATSAPNFVRGAVVPMTLGFAFFRDRAGVGVTGAGIAVGAIVLGLAFVAVTGLEETFGKDLDFIEE